MEKLSPYQLQKIYKPSWDLVTADALSLLYTAATEGKDGLNLNWPMLYLKPKATCYKELNAKTINKPKEKYQFIVNAGNICFHNPDGEKVNYVPITQRGNTILHFHWTLGRVRGRNLCEMMKHKVWWPNMY